MCDIVPSEENVFKLRAKIFKKSAKNVMTAIVMVGGPGSGKSTGKTACVKELNLQLKDFVVLDPDQLLIKLFNNNPNCYWSPEQKKDIFQINNENFVLAIREKYNIIFDGTGKNFRFTYNNVITPLKKNGYKVVICVVLLDVLEARKRIASRFKETQRNVDEEFIVSAYAMLDSAILKYINLNEKQVDAIYVYDNTERFGLMFSKTHNRFTCYLPSKVKQRFPRMFHQICSYSK